MVRVLKCLTAHERTCLTKCRAGRAHDFAHPAVLQRSDPPLATARARQGLARSPVGRCQLCVVSPQPKLARGEAVAVEPPRDSVPFVSVFFFFFFRADRCRTIEVMQSLQVQVMGSRECSHTKVKAALASIFGNGGCKGTSKSALSANPAEADAASGVAAV